MQKRPIQVGFLKTIFLYKEGFAKYERENRLNFNARWRMFKGEVKELLQERNFDELNDVIFTFGCLVRYVTGLHMICYLAWPTVRKMAQRYQDHGCTRSLRNCKQFCKHK